MKEKRYYSTCGAKTKKNTNCRKYGENSSTDIRDESNVDDSSEKYASALPLMLTHPHQSGVTRILTSSPTCQNSCLFTRISTLQAGSKI